MLQHFGPGHLASFCAHLPLLPPLCRTLIDKDVSIPPETFRKHVDASLTYINRALKQMSRLFLVEDLVDSLKVSRGDLQSLSILIVWSALTLSHKDSSPGCSLFITLIGAVDTHHH